MTSVLSFPRRRYALSLIFFSLAGASAAASEPLRVCLVSGSAEYESDASLASFQKQLEAEYEARAVLLRARGMTDLPGLEALDSCDVALFFTRRLEVEGEQLERVKRYSDAGRPIVAVRTASHGFQKWLEFDKVVLGGNYGRHAGPGRTTTARAEDAARGHPVLAGVGLIRSTATLYRTSPLAPDTALLMTGVTPEGAEPLAWTRVHRGGRVFYTSLGAPGDFENASFRRLLANALFWAANRPVERIEPPAPARRTPPQGPIRLRLRTRFETFRGTGAWRESFVEEEMPAAEVAILICDLWDHHWCQGAEARVDALAPRVAEVVEAARARGIQVIHAPSETMGFYAGLPQRRRMELAPTVEPPAPLEIAEGPLPIDDSDGGCDTAEKPWYPAWTRQHPRVSIGELDGISENGREVHNFIRQEGIRTLIYMGVHTNMCVLGRSFGIRQMARWGIRTIIARDLTDAMYDPRDPPGVSHDAGTALVIEHIEKHYGPSATSADLLAAIRP